MIFDISFAKIKFLGELQGLEAGIQLLEKRLGYIVSQEGLPVVVKQNSNGLRVHGDKG